MTTPLHPDQTYLVILGAAEAHNQTRIHHNARILAEHGNNQLGRPHPHNPDYRIWNGNLIRHGHHNQADFITTVNQLLPGHMYIDMAHHEHAHLTPGQPTDTNPTGPQWVYCHPGDDGAVPLTIGITQVRGQTPDPR